MNILCVLEQYTGMSVGSSHKWTYSDTEWKEADSVNGGAVVDFAFDAVKVRLPLLLTLGAQAYVVLFHCRLVRRTRPRTQALRWTLSTTGTW